MFASHFLKIILKIVQNILVFNFRQNHGTIIQTGITCKEIYL